MRRTIIIFSGRDFRSVFSSETNLNKSSNKSSDRKVWGNWWPFSSPAIKRAFFLRRARRQINDSMNHRIWETRKKNTNYPINFLLYPISIRSFISCRFRFITKTQAFLVAINGRAQSSERRRRALARRLRIHVCVRLHATARIASHYNLL